MKKIIIPIIVIIAAAALLIPCFGFEDVEEGKWYTEGVVFCHANGYMNGVSEDLFDRNSPVTRAMFMTVLAKIDGADLTAYDGKSSFSDVKTDGWYTAAIEWGYQKKLASGIGDGVFGYKNPVTREQIALFLYVYGEYINSFTAEGEEAGIDLTQRDDLEGFVDAERVHSWALEAVEWAVGSQLLSGSGEGILDPRGNCTRAQISVIIRKFVCDILSDCDHQWVEVSCTENGHCSVCNMISANALGHDFEEHICTQSADCLRCGFEKIPEQHELTVLTCVDDSVCLKCGYVYEKAEGHKIFNLRCTVCNGFENCHTQMHYYVTRNYQKFEFKEPINMDSPYKRQYYGQVFSGVDPYGYKYDFCVGVNDPKIMRGNIYIFLAVYDETGELFSLLNLGITTLESEVYNFSYYCPLGDLSGGFKKAELDSNFNFVKYDNGLNETNVKETIEMAKIDLAYTLALLNSYMRDYAGGISLDDYGFNTEKMF